MCVAYPGRVIEINGRTAKVDFAGNAVNVNIGVVDTRPGEYVLVHAGCAIESMPEEKALEIIGLFKDIEASA
jgi:hydrogenase expression/formation protein HypC